MKQIINIDYTAVDINATLESIEAILKASCCHVNNQVHEQSIYNYLETSNTIYEQLTICNKCKEKGVNRSTFDIKRQFVKNKYYTVDTVFPLFRGLYCLRESFAGSSYTKEVRQHEISIYKEALKLIYFFNGNARKYNDEEVKKLYTDFEFNIILPELLAGLVQNLMTTEEESLLLELLRRDENIATFIDKLEDTSKRQHPIEITPILPDFSPVIIWNPTIFNLLREYLCMGFSLILTQLIKKIKTISAKINMRSISDFRLIFELETSYESCVFNIRLNEDILGNIVFSLESEDSTQIVSTHFKQEV